MAKPTADGKGTYTGSSAIKGDPQYRGKVVIQEIQAHLNAAICSKLRRMNKQAPELQRVYGISKIDLHSLITGTNQVPLARVIMFAVALGLDVDIVVSETDD